MRTELQTDREETIMPQKHIAVVTGASGGFGRAFVQLLLQKPGIDEIWAIARNRQRLEALQQALGARVRVFSLDLAQPQAFDALAEHLKEESPRIAYLVNNAGYAKFCDYSDLSVAQSLDMLSLNCGGVVAVGLTCLPYMPRGGRILNIASQASFQPLPYQNLYSASKAFVRSYSRALNVELRGRGITVTAVCPGWMKTALYDRADIGAKRATRTFMHMVEPEPVAAKALRDADRGRDMSVYSLFTKSCHVAAKLLPQSVVMRAWLLQQRL